MNYPYSEPLAWHAKAFGEAGRGAHVVCLCFSESTTEWWWKFVRRSSKIWFLPKHITFEGHARAASFVSVLVEYQPFCDGPPTIDWWPPD